MFDETLKAVALFRGLAIQLSSTIFLCSISFNEIQPNPKRELLRSLNCTGTISSHFCSASFLSLFSPKSNKLSRIQFEPGLCELFVRSERKIFPDSARQPGERLGVVWSGCSVRKVRKVRKKSVRAECSRDYRARSAERWRKNERESSGVNVREKYASRE